MERRPFLGLMVSAAGWLAAGAARADGAEERGLAIARTADQRDSGFGDSTADLKMVLTNRAGNVSERRLRLRVLEVSNDGDKSLVVFDSPGDVRGTAILTHTHRSGNDDQWIYLPSLRRVKRIASTNKSGSFVGSEFAYEDLSSQEVDKYTYKYIKDEPIAGEPCFVVERKPRYEKSGYLRQLVWIDQKEYRTLRTDFFNQRNELMKTLTASNFNQYAGKYWRATKLEMINHQTGKGTQMLQNNIRLKTGLAASIFEPSSLERAL